MIYLDNNATTPVAGEVFDAMRPFLQKDFGNPSSAHFAGTNVRKAVDNAREAVARLVGARSPGEITFTSSGTEADNWAILGTLEAMPEKKHVITTRVEHEAVRKLCEKLEDGGYRVSWIEVDEDGSLDITRLREELTDDTAIVSAMLANNETGILFPVAEIAEIVKESSGAVFHVDAVNAAGKVPLDVRETNVDLLSISAHKFHGPKGIGALYIREGVKLSSMLIGGGQESGRRAGTEAVHQIAGMGAAALIALDLAPMENVRRLRDKLESQLLSAVPNAFLNGTNDPLHRLPNTSNISFAETNGEMILHRLDELGICVSTGSACNSETQTASPVLQAMNVPYSRAMGAIRFSLGRYSSEEDIEAVVREVPRIVNELRELLG